MHNRRAVLTNVQTIGAPTASVPTVFAADEVVGPWRIEGELGRGGMSTVYAVVHTEIGKRAAMKVVHGTVLTGEFTAERVILEAQVVNKVGHPNIVDIFESGTLPDGRPYLVMERLTGMTLGERVLAGRIPPDQVIAILLQLCDALAAAHAAHIVHRDLKLDNVFLVDGPDGPETRAKILDWGIAKIITATPRNTFADRLIGTPQYVSPEQARGGEITPASDIYSLGIMAYELFLEGPPFVSDSAAELLVMHLRDEPPAPHDVWPDIPAGLERLLLAMLDKSSANRPTARDVARELEAVRAQLRRRTVGGVRPEAPLMTMPAFELPLLARASVSSARPTPAARELASLREPSIERSVIRPRLQRGRVLFGAIAVITLVAGVGTMEALLSADASLETAEAGAAPAEDEVTPAPVGDQSLTLAAPSAPIAATATPDLAAITTVVMTDPAPAAAPVKAKPAPRRHRSSRARGERTASTAAARSAPVAPVAAQVKPHRSLGTAARPRREVSALDPDGTIEPYR